MQPACICVGLLSRPLFSSLAIVGALTVSRSALAFDFTEHAHITKLALDDIMARHPGARARFEDVRGVVASRFTCDEGAFLEESPPTCLSLVDLPALSGDHAAGPLSVKWKWFDDCVAPREQVSLVEKLPAIVVEIYESEQSPEQVPVHKPDIRGFVGVRAEKSASHWPLAASISDIRLQEVDDTYTQLAERGHPHFRPRLAAATAALAAQRRGYSSRGRDRNKPEYEAYAWYADLHWGALRFARAARREPDAERARFLGATAIYLELIALHYVQDGVSAGHIVPDATRLANPSLNLTHDEYCQDGIDVDRPTGLCLAWTPARVDAALCDAWDRVCSPRSKVSPHIVGDHQIALDPARGEVTLAWAVGVSSLSLDEVFRELEGDARVPESAVIAELPTIIAPADTRCITDPSIELDGAFQWACRSQLTPDDPVPGFERQRTSLGWQPAFYRCVSSWWDTRSSLEDRRNELADAWDLGFFSALRYLPQPVDTPKRLAERQVWSGGGIDVSLSMIGQADAGTFRALPMLRTGISYGPPRHIAPFAVDVFGELVPGRVGVDTPSDRTRVAMRVGGGGGMRVFWKTLPLESSVDVAADWVFYEQPKPYLHFHTAPVAWAVVDRQVLNLAIAPTLDYFHDLGVTAGITLDALMWPEN